MEDTFYTLLVITALLGIPAAVYLTALTLLAIQATRGGHTFKELYQALKNEF